MSKKQKPDDASSQAANQEAHVKNMALAYERLIAIRNVLQNINSSKQQFVKDGQLFKACLSDVTGLFVALHSSKRTKTKNIIIDGEKFIITRIRTALVKSSTEVREPVGEIKGSEYITPPLLWERFLVKDAAVDQCEKILEEEIKTDSEVAAAVEAALSKQEPLMPPPSEETEKHHQSIISQLADQLAINTDRIVAMCKLLPRSTKEKFQSIIVAVFGVEASVFQAITGSLLQKHVLIETTQFYLIADQSFAVQAVANFQRNEDMRSVYHKLQKIGETNG